MVYTCGGACEWQRISERWMSCNMWSDGMCMQSGFAFAWQHTHIAYITHGGAAGAACELPQCQSRRVIAAFREQPGIRPAPDGQELLKITYALSNAITKGDTASRPRLFSFLHPDAHRNRAIDKKDARSLGHPSKC
jgi:hypothetical protein